MFVVVAANDDLHAGCSDPFPGGFRRNPQPTYNVGRITAPTALVASNTFGNVDFGNVIAREFSTELPSEDPSGPSLRSPTSNAPASWTTSCTSSTTRTRGIPPSPRGSAGAPGFDVATIADDVENMQIAYGVDGLYGGDAVVPNDALGRLVPVSGDDTDPNVSTQVDGDEWSPNVAGEAMFAPGDFQSQQPPPRRSPHAGVDDCHNPTLLGVMISLVAKSRNPDTDLPGAARPRPAHDELAGRALSVSNATDVTALPKENPGREDQPAQLFLSGMTAMNRLPRRERGAALVIAIVALAILTVIGIALMFVTSTESQIAANEWAINRATYASDGGIRWASVQLTDPQQFLTRPEFRSPPDPFGTVMFQLPSHRHGASFFGVIPRRTTSR